MWSRKILGLSLGIGTSYFALHKYGIVGTVEAGEKPSYPPQPHCVGPECPRTRWDEDWDKKEGLKAVRRTILIVAHGQNDAGSSGKKKNASKPQKVANKGGKAEVKKLPSDPRRFVKPKNVANEDEGCIIDQGGGGAGDGEGLSSLGLAQVNRLVAFFNEEFYGTDVNILINGTDPPSVATAKIIEKSTEKTRNYVHLETSMLDPLTPVQEPNDPHPGDVARLEAIYRKYFHREDDVNAPTGVDIIVCPPNLVGYFVCRFMQIPPDRFTNWGVANASLTELTVYHNGRTGVHRVGDIGFMDPKDVSYE